jgi:RNA polymerase sigma-70 factor, ECF subfamily
VRREKTLRDEKQLVRRMQQGERQAFTEFVDAYGSQVHRLVRRYIANPSDAEDTTQEIFVDLYRSIGNFRGEAALSTWIYRVTVNRCLRVRQKTSPEAVTYDEHLLPEAKDWRGDPERCAAKQELSAQVQGALGKLSEEHRDVVVLHEMHGLTYQECADVLNIPVGTVKSRLSNAFRRLRDSLRGYVFSEGMTRTETAMERTR